MTPRAGEVGRKAATAAETPFPVLLAAFRRRFEERLEAFLAEARGRVAEPGGDGRLVEAVSRLAGAGGKRLRPAVLWHAHAACGGGREEAAMSLALSVELLHSYLLVHDDIMDAAELRRGRPAAHIAFRDRHRARGWPGDPEAFGRSVAILVGDLAHTWADDLYRRALREAAGVEVEALDAAFADMCEEVVRGQYLELVLPFRPEPAEEDLLRVLRLKSGRYSVERPAELGALLAGAPAPTLRALRRYGEAVGEAFQLQDDILGVFGRADRVGKPVGSDLREGKFTFLVLRTLERATASEADRLHAVMGDREAAREDIVAAADLIRSSGGLEAVRTMVEERLGAARDALDDVAPDESAPGREGAAFLRGLLDHLRERDR